MAGVDDLVVYMQTAVKYSSLYIHHPGGPNPVVVYIFGVPLYIYIYIYMCWHLLEASALSFPTSFALLVGLWIGNVVLRQFGKVLEHEDLHSTFRTIISLQRIPYRFYNPYPIESIAYTL